MHPDLGSHRYYLRTWGATVMLHAPRPWISPLLSTDLGYNCNAACTQTLDLTVTIYGPGVQLLINTFKSGLWLDQNQLFCIANFLLGRGKQTVLSAACRSLTLASVFNKYVTTNTLPQIRYHKYLATNTLPQRLQIYVKCFLT